MQNLERNFDSGKRILNRFFNVCRSHNVQSIGSMMNTRIQINVMVEKMRKPRGSRGSVGLKIKDENINLWVFFSIIISELNMLSDLLENLEIQHKYAHFLLLNWTGLVHIFFSTFLINLLRSCRLFFLHRSENRLRILYQNCLTFCLTTLHERL